LYWIGLAEDRNSWRALLNVVMNIPVPQNAGNFFTPEKISASQEYDQIKVKGTAIPLQAWTGPEGTRRVRLPDFKTIGT
jgi:hypothetical protein